ncbi:MAG: CcmD family protein [Flavitalea sp.]
MIRSILLSFFSLLIVVITRAQDMAGKEPEISTGLRADQKIYVVIAVLITILAGLFIFMWRLDRRISRFERQDNK